MKNEITGIILAGGRSQRMHGIDKGLLRTNGKYHTAKLLNILEPLMSHSLVNCNQNTAVYQTITPHIVKDNAVDYQGPLQGLLTCLHRVKTPYFFCTPCDNLALDTDTVQRLISAIHNTNTQLSYANINGNKQFLTLCGKTTIQRELFTYFSNNGRSVKGFLAQQDCHEEIMIKEQLIANMNTLADYQKHLITQY